MLLNADNGKSSKISLKSKRKQNYENVFAK